MRAFGLNDLGRAREINTVRVPVPEFNDPGKEGDECFCYVRVMTQDEKDRRVRRWWQDRKEAREQADSDESGQGAWMAAASLCDEDGKWIAETNLAANELCDKLGKEPATAVTRIVIATVEANAIGDAKVEKIEKK